MKKVVFFIALTFAFVSCKNKPSEKSAGAGDAQNVAVASGDEYSLDTVSSVLNWKGSKPGGEHIGVVSITEGKISSENGKIISGSFTIDLNTIKDLDLADADMNAKLVGHLKSPDFFDVAQFPTAKFEIVSVTEITNTGAETKGTHQVTGNLTMKVVTKSISFPATIQFSDASVKAVSEPFTINRTQWGVNYGSKSIFAELKDKFINDEIIISLDLSFSKI